MRSFRSFLMIFVFSSAFFFCGSDAYCQNSAAKSKKKEIKIPKTALDPAKTKEGFEHEFNEVINSILSVDVPETLAKYRDSEDVFISCSYVMTKRDALKELVNNPDLEEVLHCKKDWYVNFYNDTQVLTVAAGKIEAAVNSGDEASYDAAAKQYKALADKLYDAWKSRSKHVVRLDKDQLKVLKEKNRRRRRQEYVRLYKMLEKDGLLKKDVQQDASGKEKKSSERKNKE